MHHPIVHDDIGPGKCGRCIGVPGTRRAAGSGVRQKARINCWRVPPRAGNRARGDQDSFRVPGRGLVPPSTGHCGAPACPPHLAQILDEVEGEGVVVVDDQQHPRDPNGSH